MQLQFIFDEISQRQKDLRQCEIDYSNALKNDQEYQTLIRDLKEMNSKKRLIEARVRDSFGEAVLLAGSIRDELKIRKDMLSNEAITMLMSGQTVAVKDQRGRLYEPIWSVRFKRVKKMPTVDGINDLSSI